VFGSVIRKERALIVPRVCMIGATTVPWLTHSAEPRHRPLRKQAAQATRPSCPTQRWDRGTVSGRTLERDSCSGRIEAHPQPRPNFAPVRDKDHNTLLAGRLRQSTLG